MTRQEEIREGIRCELEAWGVMEPLATDAFLDLLDKLGVVIKMESELPQDIVLHDHGEVRRIHYEAVESLV